MYYTRDKERETQKNLLSLAKFDTWSGADFHQLAWFWTVFFEFEIIYKTRVFRKYIWQENKAKVVDH